MTKIIPIILLILSICLLTACLNTGVASTTRAGNRFNSGIKATATNLTGSVGVSGTEYNPVTPANAVTPWPGERTYILFIGNSLTNVGEVPSKFTALCNLTNKLVYPLEKTPGGYELKSHLSDLKSGKYDSFIKDADIVILQEYGSFGHDTANAVKEIQKLFKAGTKFYFLLTEFDIPGRQDELKDVHNITYIPSGYAHNLLLEDGFEYAQLHAVNDYHPNSLYGYIAALTVYSMIFDADCIGTPYSFLDQKTVELIPGNTDEEKAATVAKIQEKVMQAVKADKSAYE
jgi:hypothetical protein